MSEQILGQCSKCGGDVVIYGYTTDPRPTCKSCGAKKARQVIEMEGGSKTSEEDLENELVKSLREPIMDFFRNRKPPTY